MGKRQNTRKHHIQESQKVNPFPAGDHNVARNRQQYDKDKHKTQITKIINNRGIPSVSKNITGGLNMLTVPTSVDQDT